MDANKKFYNDLLLFLFTDFQKKELQKFYTEYFEYIEHLTMHGGGNPQSPIRYNPVCYLKKYLNFSEHTSDEDIELVFKVFKEWNYLKSLDDDKDKAYDTLLKEKEMPPLITSICMELNDIHEGKNITKYSETSVQRNICASIKKDMRNIEQQVFKLTSLIDSAKQKFINMFLELCFYDETSITSIVFRELLHNINYSTFEYSNQNKIRYEYNKYENIHNHSHPYKLMKNGYVRIKYNNAHLDLLNQLLWLVWETDEALRKNKNDKYLKNIMIGTCNSKGKGEIAKVPFFNAFSTVIEYVEYTENEHLLKLLHLQLDVLRSYKPYTEHDILRQLHMDISILFYDYFEHLDENYNPLKKVLLLKDADKDKYKRANETTKELIKYLYTGESSNIRYKKECLNKGVLSGYTALSPYMKNYNDYGKLRSKF